jgi:uncharacterized membrane protein YbhN (UPF0104 family)
VLLTAVLLLAAVLLIPCVCANAILSNPLLLVTVVISIVIIVIKDKAIKTYDIIAILLLLPKAVDNVESSAVNKKQDIKLLI